MVFLSEGNLPDLYFSCEVHCAYNLVTVWSAVLEVENVRDGLLLRIWVALLPLRIRHDHALGKLRVLLVSALKPEKKIINVAICTAT